MSDRIPPYHRSFKAHPKSKYWSNENNISPRKVYISTNKKYLFDCNTCNHSFAVSPNNVVNGKFCPFCANQKLCTDEECETCYAKSFLSNNKAKFWSDENEVTPRQVFKSSNIKYKFNCATCDHIFEMTPGHITNGNNFCPYCSNPVKKLCNADDCETCYNNSFMPHPRSEYWSDKNDVSPRQVTKSSGRKYKFDCPNCGQIYEASIANIARGQWCNCTRRKTEKIVYEYLQSIMDCQVVKQKKFKWCRQSRCLPFDFCIKDFKIIIELDGIQHFKQTYNWKNTETT